jgi:hypothetical protein
MKKDWDTPMLEVLHVDQTMKHWPGHGGGGSGEPGEENPPDGFDS